jgi:transcriptional regulator with XRE-family HTH domain
MIRTDKLRGIIAAQGLSQRKVAENLGISSNTFYSKMKKGIFDSVEIEALIDLLQIDDPIGIFFAKKVS